PTTSTRCGATRRPTSGATCSPLTGRRTTPDGRARARFSHPSPPCPAHRRDAVPAILASVDSEYALGRPHPALAQHVVRYLGYREHSATPVRRRQAPGASCALIISLGPRIRLHGPAGPSAPASFLAGMHDGPVLTEFTGHQH